MPRTHGDGIIHVSSINSIVEVDEPLPEVSYAHKMNETIRTIGKYCSELIDDRSTLQMGIGAIPDAVLSCLGNHKDLGIHTEMFSDGVIPLVEKGIVTNKYKRKHRGKIVTGFAIGTKKLYDFVDDNPQVAFLDIDYVNDTKVIRQNPKVVAINSALEIDLTGQVCSDSIGYMQYSGVGGQMDFMRGAALSEGGKPIIAIASTTNNGGSKIMPFLKTGSGVVTTRAHVHYVVTEYGVAYLFGKNLKQRAMALLNISHPQHREFLEKAIHERFGG
jgi:acyl-CoA hydrolase